MHFFKLGLISIVLLFLLLTGISLFIPSRVRISRAIDLEADRSVVMDRIRDAGEWKKWYPGLDTAKPYYVAGSLKGMILNESDPSGSVYIAIVTEDSNEITARFAGKKMDPVINVWKVISPPGGNSLTLQWYMDFHLRWYPWEKFASLLLEKSYGPKMEQGLSNLKKLVEN
jgi:hypothetical protein